MKHNHFSKKICLSFLGFLFTIVAIQAQDQYVFQYESEKKVLNIEYGKPFSVKILGVNKLDYKYDVKVEFELPKPHTQGGPNFLFDPNKNKMKIKSTEVDCVEAINNYLKERLTKFGQEEINKWFDQIKKMECISKIENEHKKGGTGYLIIEEKDISREMLKTKSGGAIIITIIAKPKKWKLKTKDSWESEGKVVEIEELNLDDEPKKRVEKHLKIQIIRFNFSGPKGVTFSMGPYFTFLLERNKYGRIKNPEFEEGSTDDEKKDEYRIGLTEESKHIYGISAFWNAPFGTISKTRINFGICWGVAYDLQNKLDKGINGLLGLYFQPQKSPALIHIGAAVGLIEDLPDGYEINTAIGENEEIPLKSKVNVGIFLSISFKI